MKCRSWTQRLPSLLDEPEGSPERSRLEAHLRECGGCRGRWELLSRVKDAAKDLDGKEPEKDLWPGIQKELAGQGDGAPREAILRGPIIRLALGWSAVLATMLIVTIWLWPQRQAEREPHAGKTRPRGTTLSAPEPTAAALVNAAPAPRARSRPRPAVRRRTPPATEKQYLVDDLAAVGDSQARDGRVQYMLPVLAPDDIGGSVSGQQYVMPAVHAAVREPF